MTAATIASAAPGTSLSIVTVIGDRAVDNLDALFRSFRAALTATDPVDEIIMVVSDRDPRLREWAASVRPDVARIVVMPHRFSEAAMLREGVRSASASRILLLPPYIQIDLAELPGIVRELDVADMVLAVRARERDALINRARGMGFRLVGRIAGRGFKDLGCLVRAAAREMLEELLQFEGQTNFLPVLAEFAGYRVVERRAAQASSDQRLRVHRPALYLAGILDALAISFLVRFLAKPFRLFGAVGGIFSFVGLLLTAILIVERVFGVPLATRPALLFAVLLIVLGIQIASIGLIAEIVLFTRLPKGATYRIRRIINSGMPTDDGRQAGDGRT
ncbi:dolichol-phosphate mannosyltransferase [Sphingomonas koreensis]|nr:dolichol-phosphate mannosyltransferase [Sphingomonas koreensis]